MSKENPNVLWIMSEQTNVNSIGCYGNNQVQTPNIDELAAGGVRFDRAYSTSPICMPSRVTYLNGQYPHTHGCYSNDNDYAADPAQTLPRLLARELNYRTGAAGKTHIGQLERDTFDACRASAGSITGKNLYHEYLKEKGLLEKLTGADNVYYNCAYTDIPYKHSYPVWTANTAMDVMDEMDEPFFMWVSFDKPHGPYNVPKDPPVQYDPDDLELPFCDPEQFSLKPFATRLGIENIWDIRSSGEERFRSALAAYYTLISMVDDNIGRLMSYLEGKDMLEDTIVIYCADHGDFGGEHGQIGKNACGGYEPIYHIPLIWSWKGEFGPEVLTGMVENVDFYPTICDLLGLETPAWVQGESYAHPLRMSAAQCGYKPFEGRESVFMEDAVMLKTVRTDQYKLSYRFDGSSEKGEMYDMIHDPNETENLFDYPEYSHVREELLRKIINHLIRTEQPEAFSEGRIKMPPWRWMEKKFGEQKPIPPDKNRVKGRNRENNVR